MKKDQRKELEKQVIDAVTHLLSKHNPKAAGKVGKHIKEAGKMIAKKFAKAVKQQEAKKKSAKEKTKGAAATLKLNGVTSEIKAVKPSTRKARVKKITQ